MTNNEAAKWIQLYIDLAKIDPTTGEEAYLNEDDRKTLEAMEMAIDAITCNQLATDCISRQPEKHTEERTETRACDYERAVEQLEHDMLYEPTFNQDDGSM